MFSQREKCLHLEFFSSAFFRIRDEYREIRRIHTLFTLCLPIPSLSYSLNSTTMKNESSNTSLSYHKGIIEEFHELSKIFKDIIRRTWNIFVISVFCDGTVWIYLDLVELDQDFFSKLNLNQFKYNKCSLRYKFLPKSFCFPPLTRNAIC